MSFWKKFKGFIKGNLNKSVKIISVNTGAVIKVWLGVLGVFLVGLATGQPTIMGGALTLGVGATIGYGVVITHCTFGTEEDIKKEE